MVFASNVSQESENKAIVITQNVRHATMHLVVTIPCLRLNNPMNRAIYHSEEEEGSHTSMTFETDEGL